MADKRNMKAKIWVYAVVLFTSAFIVLLITAYSQIKQQRNIDDFKTQISQQQNENKKYQLSYANAQEMIGKLTEENEKLADENKSFSDTIDKLTGDLDLLGEESQEKITQYEKLSEAQSEYLKGNTVVSAQVLKTIDAGVFNEKAAETYALLSSKAFSEAGRMLFDEGYKLYQKGNYSEAITKLALSRDMTTIESYSDDCLYYLAYAQHREKNTGMAVSLMKSLVQDYPTSSFVKYARNFIHRFE